MGFFDLLHLLLWHCAKGRVGIPPYRVAAGQIQHSGRVAGEVQHAGTAAGQVQHAGTVAAQLEGLQHG